MNAIDQYDITECFQSLDVEYENQLNLHQILTIFWGLGYQPISITVDDLYQRQCPQQQRYNLTLPQTIALFSKFERVPNRTTQLQQLFYQITNGSPTLSARHIQSLYKKFGDPMDEETAQRVERALCRRLATSQNYDTDTDATVELSVTEFVQILSPPSPQP